MTRILRPILVLLGLALALVLIARLGGQAPNAKLLELIEVIHDVEIGKGGGRTLHAEIARPKNPPPAPMPAVLFIHGGGWQEGTHKQNGAAVLPLFGYFTASIEYRLSDEAKWPAQIEDCKLAVRWLRANAAKYNVNPDRIGVWGMSAGAHLAACLGTMGDAKELEGNGGWAGVSSRVQAVASYCGGFDLTDDGTINDLIRQLGTKLCGGPATEKLAAWRQASPLLHITPQCPPFLIVHGDKDDTVPFAQSERMEAALRKAGVPVEFIRVKGGNHGMIAPFGQPAAEPDVQTLYKRVAAFFDKHLKK
ncbi:MAG: alpha/beta hydrolase [Verrucomicrobia bacterium]|nr:alpha/beta hydrolase [Verrucomicrobiota bacterium]